MYYTGAIGGGKLWCATPDTNFGVAMQLSYTTGSDGGGNYVNFIVPQLQYWDMIWLEINGTTSATNQIQAANYDSMSAIGTEATSDTGGGLDVCDVNNTNGDSYVAFNNIDFGTGPTSVSVRVASALSQWVDRIPPRQSNGDVNRNGAGWIHRGMASLADNEGYG